MEVNKVQFKAALKGQRSDHEGEAVVSLQVPMTELAAVLRLATWHGQLLDVTVEVTET